MRDIECGKTKNQDVEKKLKDIFVPIFQLPELPTGCEITSLTMVLNYYGFDVDKCAMAYAYLRKGEIGTVSFYKVFEGDPWDADSFGCYAPVICDSANRFLSDMHSDMKAKVISGEPLDELLKLTDDMIPIIIWGTIDCREGHITDTWIVNGEELNWISPEHCMVLVGYDENVVWVADPMHGDIRSFDKGAFTRGYEALYRQAVIIE